jgi:TonB-linked SusC/RagA family outer membrane protein
MLGITTLNATTTNKAKAENAMNSEFELQQNQRTISGTIVDEKGEAVIGANVIVPGTSIGTITNVSGKFELNVPADCKLIRVSYLGYETQNVTVSNQRIYNVTLQPESKGLDEVVVIGYGTVKKRDLTGAVSSVKTADIIQSPTSNAMEAIQGRVAGMDITRTSGGAGSGVNILIRGTKTIGYTDMFGNKTRNTEPLFIIDGVQGGSYSDLNPNDIESIDVLKDASSTAIYGSLGANGVVIITTKKGKENKVNVTLDSYYGVNGFVDYPTPRTGESYINVRREAYRTVGQWTTTADDYKIFTNEEWNAIQNNNWVNWVDLVTRQGVQQSHNVTFSSGKDKVKSYLSLGYFNEQGIFERDDITKYTLRTNLDYEVKKWLSVGVSSQLTYFDKNSVPSSMLTQALTYIPLGTPYDENGNIVLFPVSGDANRLSPLANYVSEDKAVNNTVSIKTFNTAYVLIEPIKNLKFRSNLSAAINASRQGVFNGKTPHRSLAEV